MASNDYSKIGNYVHWHADNYIKYGIHHKEDGPSLLSENVIDASKEAFRKSFQQEQTNLPNLDELQAILNWLKKPSESGATYRGTGLSPAIFNEAWEVFVNIVTDKFNEVVPPRITREMGTIEGIYMPGVHRIKAKAEQKTVSSTKIINGINSLQKIIDSANGDNGYSNADLAILKQLGTELTNALAAYTAMTNADLLAGGAPKRLAMDKAKPFIDILNKAVAYSTGVANAQRGDLWEDLIAVASTIGKYRSREALKQAMQDAISTSVLGSQKSPVIFQGDLFSDEANFSEILGSTYTQKEKGFYYSRHQTQNKVDVVIQWDGTDINVSAKNVSLSGKNANQVKIVESMSLLMGLSNLGDPNLATHYINQRTIDNVTNNLYYLTAQLIKISLVEQGLRGYKLNNAKADVFIINDNASGNTIIVSMARLLEKIVDAFPNIEQFTSFHINPAMLSLSSANHYHPDGYGPRITALLAAVHNAKVTIHLKPNIFKP